MDTSNVRITAVHNRAVGKLAFLFLITHHSPGLLGRSYKDYLHRDPVLLHHCACEVLQHGFFGAIEAHLCVQVCISSFILPFFL